MKIKLKENNIQKILFGVLPLRKNYKKIRFYDYDGTLLYEYTPAQFLALSSLPTLPNRTSENLTCDGWNWTLSEITSHLNTVDGDVNVGAIYHTTDDKTHITCKPTKVKPVAYIRLSSTVASAVTVDWGDGTTDTWTTTSESTKSHTYTGVTDSSVYDIAISCSSGTYSFPTYIAWTDTNNQSCVYTDIKLSNKITSLGGSCFSYCYSLQSITIPSGVTSLSDFCFYNCYSLQSINIPNSVTSFDTYCFYGCSSLQSITISSGVISLGSACFMYCSSLQSIIIPDTVTSLGSSCFSACHSLQSITISSGVTTLGRSCFDNCYSLRSINIPSGVTSLGNYCIQQCYSLKSVTISDTVTSLPTQCFYGCTSLQKIYMKSTTPTTLASINAIPNNANLVIYVPRGTLSAYQSASNWSTYSSKMVEYNY